MRLLRTRTCFETVHATDALRRNKSACTPRRLIGRDEQTWSRSLSSPVASSTGNGDRTTLGVVTETNVFRQRACKTLELLGLGSNNKLARRVGAARGAETMGARERAQRSEFRSVEPKHLVEPHAQPMVIIQHPRHRTGVPQARIHTHRFRKRLGRLGPRGPSSTRRARGCVMAANEVAMPSVGSHCPRISSL